MDKDHALRDQSWFEMNDLQRKNFNKSVWVTLRSAQSLIKQGEYGYEGYIEEYSGAGTVAVSISEKDKALNLEWMDIGLSRTHMGGYYDDHYVPADIFHTSDLTTKGLFLVLAQRTPGQSLPEWHLHQDIVITFGLIREGDHWLCPDEGYELVAKLTRDLEGIPVLMEVKSAYLKEYLNVREMGLVVSTYNSRMQVVSNADMINWPDKHSEIKTDLLRWEGNVNAIHEGGHPFGEKWAAFHISRTDIVDDEDLPEISYPPTDDKLVSRKAIGQFAGKQLFHIEGELWKTEWVDPSTSSTRIRGDESSVVMHYIIDEKGTTVTNKELRNSGKWLWFNPGIIKAILERRGGEITWYTRDTGQIGLVGHAVHFGINPLGFINVFAEDIAIMPIWVQKIWAGYSISPDGKVSKELLDSQVRATPASTEAPEASINERIVLLNQIFLDRFKVQLFDTHPSIPEIKQKLHRFRALDQDSLFGLAKDLTRVVIDSINIKGLRQIAIEIPKSQTSGQIKLLELVLGTKFDLDSSRRILAPFVGMYELRLGDAHLPSDSISEAMNLIGIDQNKPFTTQGYQLIDACLNTINELIGVFEKWDELNKVQQN